MCTLPKRISGRAITATIPVINRRLKCSIHDVAGHDAQAPARTDRMAEMSSGSDVPIPTMNTPIAKGESFSQRPIPLLHW